MYMMLFYFSLGGAQYGTYPVVDEFGNKMSDSRHDNQDGRYAQSQYPPDASQNQYRPSAGPRQDQQQY